MKKAKKTSKKNFYIIGAIVLAILLTLIFMMVSQNTNNNDKRIAVLETNQGVIKIELYVDQMPITTKNFIDLIESGFYDDTRFHRVIADFMVQGGDPKTADTSLVGEWGTGGPGYTIEDEFVSGLSNTRGTISMANTGRPNTGGSQFFINLVDNSFLDFDKQPSTSRHPVFGEVIEGMDVVDNIASVQVSNDGMNRPVQDIIILRAYME